MTEYEDEIKTIQDILDYPEEGDKLTGEWQWGDYFIYMNNQWRFYCNNRKNEKIFILNKIGWKIQTHEIVTSVNWSLVEE